MEIKDCPMISIVLPVYNGEKYLAQSIESCIDQSFEDWELLIIDDCSSDSSAMIAQEFEKKDSRIHYYKNEVNLKLPRSLNRGFSLAKGKYLTWTSDDNYYRVDALKKMLYALQSRKADFVFAGSTVINGRDEVIERKTVSENPKHFIWHHNIVGACFMYSREVYQKTGEYDPNVFLCEDYDYWLRIFPRFRVVYVDEDLYVYRLHEKALTATHRPEQFLATEKVLLKNMKYSKKYLTGLDKGYAHRALVRSCSLRKSVLEKYKYLPGWCCYKVWYELLGKRKMQDDGSWRVKGEELK